jgi:hypothetical protein
VVAVGEPEAEQQPARGVAPEAAVEQLLPEQAHRGRAQDHHALLLEPDRSPIGPEVLHVREQEVFGLHGCCAPQ